MKKKPTIIDLFCGCGGFGLGAELSGFHTIAALDIDKTLQSAYKLNFPNTNVIQADLSKIGESYWREIIGNTEIDGVIGGPPCQGYSRIGTSNIDDPRRLLLSDFFRHVNLLMPKFFVMENVEGLMDKKNIGQLDFAIKTLNKAYTVLDPIVIDASTFGAPTKRKRVIVIGYDQTRISRPILINESQSIHPRVNVKDAISDLNDPIARSTEDLTNFGWNDYKQSDFLSEYAKKMRKPPPLGLGCQLAINNLINGKVSGNYLTVHSEKVSERYKLISQGDTDPISRSKKLEWLGLCPTLRAGTGADKGSFQAVRPIHPSNGRVITVREAARLQGFPDWFCFHHTKWHSFRMIGNSVSPIVSQAVLTKIFEALNEDKPRLRA